MANSIIFKTKLIDYKSIVWQGQPMFRHYPKLKNHLKQNLGDDYALLFAEPHITDEDLKGFSVASWSSELISNKAVSLTNLPANVQTYIKEELKHKIEKIQEYSQQKLESENPEDNKWGQLINKALEIPDESHIFVENDNIVLVAWGFQVTDKNENKFNFKKEFTQPDFNKKERERLEKEKNEKDKKERERLENEKNENDKKERERLENDKKERERLENEKNENDKKERERLENEKNEKERERLENEKNENDKKERERLEKENKLKTNNTNNSNNEPPVNDNNNNKKPWWKRFWWLWLLILIIIIILLLKGCNFGSSNLPDDSGRIVPIDSTKIITDPDSVKSIVSDRINIALIGDNKSIEDFAKKFKKIYSGSEYQIIYYDTATVRIQIQIPAEEREQIKNDLPTKLSDFEMLIWYESIFNKNYVPNDPGFNDYTEYWQHQDIKSFEAWNYTRGDSSIIIAIVDDGFDMTHIEFKDKIVTPWNVPSFSTDVNTGLNSYHGTHVAGCALGLADNSNGVSGVAPNCKFMPVQVGDYNGTMSTTSVIDGVLYAINHGADVINMSLGLNFAPEVEFYPQSVQMNMINTLYKDEEIFWKQLFKVAYDKNIIVVLAGGNQNIMIGMDPMQRSGYTINVSATDSMEQKAVFSNYGYLSTISAPGVDIYSSVPDDKYEFLSGTSMASPIVAGGIALIKSINPTLTFEQIVEIIQKTGIPVNSNLEKVGNIIQLDLALKFANDGKDLRPIVGCPDVQKKIDSLLMEIEKLKRMCPDSSAADTMKIPDNNKDFSFALGKWKSTTKILNDKGEEVTIYFEFFSTGTGIITLVEPDGTECTANLKLELKSGKFVIDQIEKSNCSPKLKEYAPYLFECKPDISGCAECTAQNKTDKANFFDFSLIKIN